MFLTTNSMEKDEGDNYFSILVQLCQKKIVHLWPFNHAHLAREHFTLCHNVVYNTDIKILTLCVQIAMSLKRFKYYCFLDLYWKAQYDSLQPHICIMHAVINKNIINNNNLVI